MSLGILCQSSHGVLLGLDENIGFEDYLVVPENYESMRQPTTCRDGKVFIVTHSKIFAVSLGRDRSKNVLDATFHLPPSRWHGICKNTYSLERVTTKSEKQKQLMSHVYIGV
ncbi:hypothetical protein GQX74_014414 [Glossina fuscipes]|nr:hypothetical protein GQX74_014414 [Glossina fuscipes]